MSVSVDFVCLANSWKHNGRCVAGIVVQGDQPKEWIRPISDREGHGLLSSEIRFPSGNEPEPLDIVRVVLDSATPMDFQQENWLNSGQTWELVGRWAHGRLPELLSSPASLWSPASSSNKGTNDYLSRDVAMAQQDSIRLIQPEGLRLHVVDHGFMEVKKEVRAIFDLDGTSYNLRVTDPDILASYRNRAIAEYPLPGRVLTVSLTEFFHENAYLVAAAVIPGT